MGDLSAFMDIMILLCGVYVAYAAILLKVKGEIKESVLLSKNLDIKKCKDLEGYKKYLFPRALAIGICTALFGVAGLINANVVSLGNIYFVLLALVVLVLIWYFITYRRGIQRFWEE